MYIIVSDFIYNFVRCRIDSGAIYFHCMHIRVSFPHCPQDAPSLPLKLKEDLRTECSKYGKVKKITLYDVFSLLYYTTLLTLRLNYISEIILS